MTRPAISHLSRRAAVACRTRAIYLMYCTFDYVPVHQQYSSRLVSRIREIFECGPARLDPRWRVTSRRRESDRASVKFAPARRQLALARKPRWRADEPRQRAFRAGKRQSAPARGSRWRGFRHAGAPISRRRAELHAGERILSCYDTMQCGRRDSCIAATRTH